MGLAVDHAHAGCGNDQALLRTGDSDIAETTFLLKLCPVI